MVIESDSISAESQRVQPYREKADRIRQNELNIENSLLVNRIVGSIGMIAHNSSFSALDFYTVLSIRYDGSSLCVSNTSEVRQRVTRITERAKLYAFPNVAWRSRCWWS